MAQDPRLLLQKADKQAQSATGGFSFFGGRTEKWEQAADLYTQAANAFRLQKQSAFSTLRTIHHFHLPPSPTLIHHLHRHRSRPDPRKSRQHPNHAPLRTRRRSQHSDRSLQSLPQRLPLRRRPRPHHRNRALHLQGKLPPRGLPPTEPRRSLRERNRRPKESTRGL